MDKIQRKIFYNRLVKFIVILICIYTILYYSSNSIITTLLISCVFFMIDIYYPHYSELYV